MAIEYVAAYWQAICSCCSTNERVPNNKLPKHWAEIDITIKDYSQQYETKTLCPACTSIYLDKYYKQEDL